MSPTRPSPPPRSLAGFVAFMVVLAAAFASGLLSNGSWSSAREITAILSWFFWMMALASASAITMPKFSVWLGSTKASALMKTP